MKQTRVALILQKTLLSNFFVRCSCQRRGDVRGPRSAFRTFHTTLSPVQEMFWFPPVRWLSEELLSVSRFSVEKSLSEVSHARFVLFVSHVSTPSRHHSHTLECCCGCEATLITVRFFVAPHCPLGFPHCGRLHRDHPATRHDSRT